MSLRFKTLVTVTLTLFSLNSALAAEPHEAEDCPDNKNHFAHAVVNKLGLQTCGPLGSVDDRIADCKSKGAAPKDGFMLVTRTTEGKEVHKDLTSGFLWGDVLLQSMTFAQAKKACRDNLAEVGRIAGGKKWRLPTVDEVKAARENANKDTKKYDPKKYLPLPGIDKGYQWTTTKSKDIKNTIMAFDEDVFYGDNEKNVQFKVRCIAE